MINENEKKAMKDESKSSYIQQIELSLMVITNFARPNGPESACENKNNT